MPYVRDVDVGVVRPSSPMKVFPREWALHCVCCSPGVSRDGSPRVEPRLTGGFTAFPRRLAPFQQPGKMSETIEKLLAQEKTYRLVRRPAARTGNAADLSARHLPRLFQFQGWPPWPPCERTPG